jgi:CubicO group peptidase (beta-lactamase class C family)
MDAFLPFSATMTARAGAALYGALANGGGPLLSPERVALATRIRRRDVDQIIDAPALKSLGYLHADPVSGGSEPAFGFGGLGGAEAYADPERRLGFAFTHNRLTPPTAEESAPGLAALLRTSLGSDQE